MDATDAQQAAPRRRGRRLALVLGTGAALLAVGYAAAVATVSGDVPRGTTIRGVSIGGMGAEQAEATLIEELGDEAAAGLPVTAGEAATELQPEESGLSVDWAATVDQASGLIWNPVDLVAHLRGDVEVEPVTSVDTTALTASLSGLAEVAARDPVEPRIRFTKAPAATMRAGEDGEELDIDAAVAAVSAAYFRPAETPLDLPMTPVPPQVGDDAATRVLAEFAEPAVALPVRVRADGTTVTVTRKDIAATLSFAPDGDTLTPELDFAGLHERLAGDLAEIETPGRDASIIIEDGQPTIVRSKKGMMVPADALGTAVFDVLAETTRKARRVTVELTRTDPEFTTADARKLNITEKLSSFRQYFAPAQYRYINVGQAAEYLNGTIIKPGETFSMNDTIKERTPANGYTEGFIISGSRFREELGGGVSIITTATWTAGFYAGLERVEQSPHSLYIDRYEAGLEATVAWGYIDLKMRNDTGNGVLITAERYDDGVRIEMWGTKKWDEVTSTFTPRSAYTDFQTIYDTGEGCVPTQGVRGFSLAVTRRRIIDGRSVSTETWPTTYAPTPRVVCGPQPS